MGSIGEAMSRQDKKLIPDSVRKYVYYEEPSIVLLHGDCLEILPLLEPNSVDLVLTDPPYGLATSKSKKTEYISSFEDTPEYILNVCVEAIRKCIGLATCVAVTTGNRNCFKYPEPEDIGCFFSPAGGCSVGKFGFINSQPILYYGADPMLKKGKGSYPNSFMTSETAEKNGHPCPKPIKAWRWLLNRCSFETDIILDPFLGSGTTAVAAKQLGRKCIGIEIESKYLDIAIERLRQPGDEVLFTKKELKNKGIFY